MILKKFLIFGNLSLDDSYKLNSYKKKRCVTHTVTSRIGPDDHEVLINEDIKILRYIPHLYVFRNCSGAIPMSMQLP